MEANMDFTYLETLLDTDLEEFEETLSDGYRHVWVIVEAGAQGILPESLAAVGQGRDIADQFGVYLFAILCGNDLPDELADPLIAVGADKVLLVEDTALAQYQVETMTTALSNLIQERRPEIVLLSATPLGNDLAPRLSQRLETGLISHCMDLGLDMAERQLLGVVSRLEGNVFQTLACPRSRPQLATLEPGAFQLPYADSSRLAAVERVTVNLEGENGRLTWEDLAVTVEQRVVSLTDAKIIVAAGRGLKDEEGFALAQQLADLLGGQIAGSRGALDEGWIDVKQQVGMTGQSVKPDLYIACGISGAIQHLVGIQDARFVIAINRDENAPIVKAANVSAIGDAKEIVAALIEVLKERDPHA